MATATNVTPRSVFCVGETIIFTANSNHADEFEFYINNVLKETETNPTTNGSTQQAQFGFNQTQGLGKGTHTVKIVAKNTNEAICNNKELTASFSLNELPDNYTLTKNKVFYNINDTVTLTAADQNSTGFNWFFTKI